MAENRVCSEEAIKVVEHKEYFSSWLKTVKGNSSFVNRRDLETVKDFSIARRDDKYLEIDANRKRRMKRNKFVLASFPSATDCVCVLQGSKNKNKVSVRYYFLCYKSL